MLDHDPHCPLPKQPPAQVWLAVAAATVAVEEVDAEEALVEVAWGEPEEHW